MRKLILFLFLPMLIACSDDAVSGDDEKGNDQTPGLLLCKKTEDGKFILETSMRQRKNLACSLRVSVTGVSSRTKFCPNGTIMSNATDDI